MKTVGFRKYSWKHFQIKTKFKILQIFTIFSSVSPSHPWLRTVRAANKWSVLTSPVWLTLGACGGLECHALPPHLKPILPRVSSNCAWAQKRPTYASGKWLTRLWLGEWRWQTIDCLMFLLPQCGVPLNHGSDIFISLFKVLARLRGITRTLRHWIWAEIPFLSCTGSKWKEGIVRELITIIEQCRRKRRKHTLTGYTLAWFLKTSEDISQKKKIFWETSDGFRNRPK
jgi:hypothetical protein